MPRANKETAKEADGRYAYAGLERVIHEKARLGILVGLTTHVDGLTFNALKELCALTDGNLSRHLAVLDEAGLVAVRKGASGRRPQSVYVLTPSGRRRFHEYVDELERVVADAVRETRAAPAAQKRTATGWLPAS
jgi:DNA-binding HxlR family transcriptional regulator